MAQEILTLKLCELEDQFSRLKSRIDSSQAGSHTQIRQEITTLEKEYAQAASGLHKNLQRSRAPIAPALANVYTEVEQAIQRADSAFQNRGLSQGNCAARAEEKILLAEYSLDFALQAANRALLLSLRALDAQLTLEERRPL